ncbi:MAG: hypothetical protein JNL58_24370 [Planctomyces sp.]|nr:hypothetical protein [Planctomyces sp.]
MKNSIFKILAVLLMVASVTFMGLSIAGYYGHPDYMSEMQSPELREFTFTQEVGERIRWTVTRRFGDKASVGTFDTPYQAIVAAHGALVTKLSEERRQREEVLGRIKGDAGEIASIERNQATDQAAMRVRIQQLETYAAQVKADVLTKSGQLADISGQSKAVRDETAQRRTDVVRLGHELEEARTDLFRLTELQRTLTDQLLRLQLENQKLEDRKEQLEGQVGE